MTDTTHDTDRDTVDLVVIGAGPGGYSTALRAAQLGESVVLVERDERPGGTCLNRGCIPTKALVNATRTIDRTLRARRYGVMATLQGIDYGALKSYRRTTVRTATEGLAGLLRFRKVRTVRGTASVEPAGDGAALPDGARHVVRVARPDADGGAAPDLLFAARDVVVATGSRPRPLPGIGFRQAVIDSDAALELDEFPDSAVIVGSGAIAVEFASIWAAAGCRVTLLARRNGVLSAWDRRVGALLTRELKRHGVDVVTHAQVTGIDTGVNLGATVHYRQGEGDKAHDMTVAATLVLAAVGRDPNTDAPWFDRIGIGRDDAGFVSVDPLGATSVPGIWAVGDIVRGHQLAHRAFEQGIVTAEAIAGLDPDPVREETVPAVVFSTPEAAMVGLTKAQAQEDGRYGDVAEAVYPMLGNARTQMVGETGSISVVTGVVRPQDGADAEPARPVVLGVHMVGPEVSELVSEAEQLVGNAVPVDRAARLVHPHPTFGEALGEALLKADGRPLHMR